MDIASETINIKVSNGRLTYYQTNDNRNCYENLQCHNNWDCENCNGKKKSISVNNGTKRTSSNSNVITKEHDKHRKRLKRKYRELSRILCDAKIEPQYWITLNCDLTLSMPNMRILKKWLKKLVDRLRYAYPGYQMLYKIEIDCKHLLHIHAAVYIPGYSHDINAITTLIENAWESISNNKKENSTLVEPYKHKIHRIYLCSPKKWEQDMLLTLVAGDYYTFGKVGKRWKDKVKVDKFLVPLSYFDESIRPVLDEYACDQAKYRADKLPNYWALRMTTKNSGTFYDIDPRRHDKILNLLNKAQWINIKRRSG